MDLEKVTAKIRPRKHWEAIDLGIALTQKYAKSLYAIWFIITLPIYLLCSAIFTDYAIWVIFGFWFLLPLWERPLLHFLSRELFGETLSVKTCVKKFFSLAKIQWFSSLTWRRPSFTRSLDLPIIQLEGLKGRQRSSRLKVIHSIGSGPAVWLTILFILTEVAFYFAILALAFLLLPAPIAESIDVFDWISIESESLLVGFILNTISYLAMSFIAPFYIACGFSIYLNQRTHLEAWDIELAFKRLAQKLEKKNEFQSTRLASISIVATLSLIFASVPSVEVLAQETKSEEVIEPTQSTKGTKERAEALSENSSIESSESSLTDHKRVKAQIKEILNGDEFNRKSQETRYVPRFESKEDNDEIFRSSSDIWFYLGKIVAFFVEFALWVFVALLIIFLVIKYSHLITGVKLPEKRKHQKPKTLFGLDMQAQSLPDNPWDVAKSLCEKGEVRQGLSLLLRASLVWYIENTGVLIREGDTELECLNKLKPHGRVEQFKYMEQLTRYWRALAYAHQMPAQSAVVSMCQHWPETIAGITEDQSKQSSDEGGRV